MTNEVFTDPHKAQGYVDDFFAHIKKSVDAGVGKRFANVRKYCPSLKVDEKALQDLVCSELQAWLDDNCGGLEDPT